MLNRLLPAIHATHAYGYGHTSAIGGIGRIAGHALLYSLIFRLAGALLRVLGPVPLLGILLVVAVAFAFGRRRTSARRF